MKLEIELANSLFQEAEDAMQNSYSPYSKFPVGAAVLTEDSKIYKGANIENASFSLTICAERVAMVNALTHGAKKIIAIAVTTDSIDLTPCGACRQFILEFGPDIIVVYRLNGEITQTAINELLPSSFSNKDLKELK